jgi:hypothetical protein
MATMTTMTTTMTMASKTGMMMVTIQATAMMTWFVMT